jgi:hypothetical protein
MVVDKRKNWTGCAGNEPMADEHAYRPLNPFHGRSPGRTGLPGLYRSHGRLHLDRVW